jgi:hypothetical protein
VSCSFGSPTTCAVASGIATLTALAAGPAAIGVPDTASAGVTASVPEPVATSGAPCGGGQRVESRHWASSASHSNPGPVATFLPVT